MQRLTISVHEGKIRATISEYKQVVEHERRDWDVEYARRFIREKLREKEAVRYLHASPSIAANGELSHHAVYNKIVNSNRLAEISARRENFTIKGSFAEARIHIIRLAEMNSVRAKDQANWSLETNPPILIHNSGLIINLIWKKNKRRSGGSVFRCRQATLPRRRNTMPRLTLFRELSNSGQTIFRALDGFVRCRSTLEIQTKRRKHSNRFWNSSRSTVRFCILHRLSISTETIRAKPAIVKLVEQRQQITQSFLN